MIEWLNLYYLTALVLMVPAKLICDKAGFNPRLSLLLLLPFAGYLALCFFLALKPWPAAAKIIKGGRDA